MTTRRRLPFFVCLFIFLLLRLCPTMLHAEELGINFRVLDTSNLPNLSAELEVIDEGGRPIEGLSSQDIQIFIDGVQSWKYSFFPLRQSGQGIDIIILVQCTADMKGDIFFRVKKSVKQIVERLAPNDRVSLITYNNTIDIVQDLTEDKLKINRLLHRTPLLEGSVSLLQVLNHALSFWNSETLTGAKIIAVVPDIQLDSYNLLNSLKKKILDLHIVLLALEVGESSPSRYIREFFRGLGGNHFNYRDENDIWALFKAMNATASGQYLLSIPQAHSLDFRTHVMKIRIEIRGISAEREVSYIGASGEGINPKYSNRRQLFTGFWLFFFCISFGAFCAVSILFLLEKLGTIEQARNTVFLKVAFIGATLGFIIALLLSVMPH